VTIGGARYQRRLSGRTPAWAIGRADLPAAAALAALETAARLGRKPALLIDSGDRVSYLAEWPGSVRRLPGPRARSAIRRQLDRRQRPAEQRGTECLSVYLGSGADLASRPAEDAGRPPGVQLTAGLAGDMLTVTASCPADDLWWRARDAVAETFAELLAASLDDPLRPIALAAGVGPVSRERLLRLAGRAVGYGPFVPVPAVIERQADRFPNRPAVIFGAETLSYARLDQLANGLARLLARRGATAGQLVPVLIENSLELPVACLALMKLGAPYVPLDPAWPADRLRAALDLLAPELLLHRPGTAVPARYRELACAIDTSQLPPVIGRPDAALGPGDLIYGIYTSGSTGAPKCALNTHGGLANRLGFMSRYFAATGGEVVLQNSRHTFDSAFWQMFWPLTTGGCCVIPAPGAFLDLAHTIDAIAAHSVTVTDFVPSIFNVLVSLADADPAAAAKLSSLRHVIVGGEEINPPMAHRLRELLPGVRITNGYGPAETAIGMAFHRVTPDDGDAIPLGRPIDNCYAVVLDSSQNLLAPGASGEIAIGGACVGAGYHREPQRTSHVFIANPLREIPGDRLYLTGDIGYFDERGRLRLTGRKDAQVKISGVRIELGRIEVAAQNCPGVRHATVLAGRLGSRKVLALFVAGDPGLSEAALRRRLLRKLPRPSVPRYVLVLPEMPLTDHGKVDRQALRALLDRKLARDTGAIPADWARAG
jgi:amino acid adenylation domain-containing protein